MSKKSVLTKLLYWLVFLLVSIFIIIYPFILVNGEIYVILVTFFGVFIVFFMYKFGNSIYNARSYLLSMCILFHRGLYSINLVEKTFLDIGFISFLVSLGVSILCCFILEIIKKKKHV
jgi:hypothetical protein